jgi:hypothetical protein
MTCPSFPAGGKVAFFGVVADHPPAAYNVKFTSKGPVFSRAFFSYGPNVKWDGRFHLVEDV